TESGGVVLNVDEWAAADMYAHLASLAPDAPAPAQPAGPPALPVGAAASDQPAGAAVFEQPAGAPATSLAVGHRGVLVEEQVSGGVELLLGIAPSPLGPVLTLGAGGVLTEVLDDVAVRLLPVDELDLRDLLAEIKVSRLLAGHRGAPAADLAALSELIQRLEQLVVAWPPGYSLDLNPVLALPDRAVVLDAAYLPPETPGSDQGATPTGAAGGVRSEAGPDQEPGAAGAAGAGVERGGS
ncbi:MAG: acetate--CoA ligase family protein, partial [Micromonosporaceae bacterium]